jgi:uncharacterized membrane protein YsdA (DUF1294 family)
MGRWRQRWQTLVEVLSSPTFWWTLLGIIGALLVWFYLFYLAIKYIDSSLAMTTTFCSNDVERNWHILAITLLTPLFLVGMLGVVTEWMTLMENREKHRKTPLKSLIWFSVLMQISGLFILLALQC